MKKQETKLVRALRRRVRNHAIDALCAVLELSKRDGKTDPKLLHDLMLSLREASMITRNWSKEDLGIKMLNESTITVGN